MKNHKITGGGSLQLHLVETGNSSGRPIMFIHGVSQCWLTWSRQLNSDLADGYRLVAMDIRGNGLSDKPREGYTDSKLWADGVNVAIQALKLDHPFSAIGHTGPLVILDYIRHYGEDGISGSSSGVSQPPARFLCHERRREHAQSRFAIAPVLPAALSRGPVPDAWIQAVRSTLCPPGDVLSPLP